MSDPIKPRYSGNLSKPFWLRVNALPRREIDAIYACGVLLQDLESRVLLWLRKAESKVANRKRMRVEVERRKKARR